MNKLSLRIEIHSNMWAFSDAVNYTNKLVVEIAGSLISAGVSDEIERAAFDTPPQISIVTEWMMFDSQHNLDDVKEILNTQWGGYIEFSTNARANGIEYINGKHIKDDSWDMQPVPLLTDSDPEFPDEILEILPDEMLDEVWGNADFGPNRSKRDVISQSLLKLACGYWIGSTAQHILVNAKLARRDHGGDVRINNNGKRYLWVWYNEK